MNSQTQLTPDGVPASAPPSPGIASNYKWYVLVLATLTHTLVMGMPNMSLPVLFNEISTDLNLNLVQIGTVWGLSSMIGIVMALVGGIIGDRIGAKRALMIACFLAGVTGALRGFAIDFVTLSITVFIAGLALSSIPTNVHKTCGIWFSGRHLGLANGSVSMGMAAGFMLGSMLAATVLSPLLGGWRNVIFFYALIAIVMGFFWTFTRPGPLHEGVQSRPATSRSLRESLFHVARVRNIWFLGLAMIGIGGCIQGALGYLPLYLRGIGWPDAAADGALATFHAASMLCTIPIAILSDRLGQRRKVLIVAGCMIMTGIGLLSVVQGAAVWIAVILAGMVRDGFMAVLMTLIIELKGVGSLFAGTATGMILGFSMFGGVIAPPLGNSLARFDPSLPFLFWSAMAAMGVVGLYLVREKRPSSD